MIVASRDIGNQRTEHIERCPLAYRLLQTDIRLDLVQGHVAGTFHHHLHSGSLGALY